MDTVGSANATQVMTPQPARTFRALVLTNLKLQSPDVPPAHDDNGPLFLILQVSLAHLWYNRPNVRSLYSLGILLAQHSAMVGAANLARRAEPSLAHSYEA